ncbi:hypothetical protein ABTE20_20265, partial [Acinetobacter baumannii]
MGAETLPLKVFHFKTGQTKPGSDPCFLQLMMPAMTSVMAAIAVMPKINMMPQINMRYNDG